MVGEAGFEPATSASRTLRAKPAALLPDTYPIITGTREQGNAGTRRVAVRRSRSRAVAAGRALYTERSPAELYRGARSSERERYARARGPRKFALADFWGEQASRLGEQRPVRALLTPSRCADVQAAVD